jgi:hypothetical protein
MFRPDSQHRTKDKTDGCGLLSVLFVVAALFAIALSAEPSWKTFSNRAGWSMNYPGDWTVASCRSCSDPTAPEVYVDFFPPKKREAGFVMGEHLADKPSTTTANEWLNDLKKTANQNPPLTEERFTLNGMPALRVRYRNPSDGGLETEAVYVVSRGQTFSIGFSAEGGGAHLESLGSYATYLEMVKTFKTKVEGPSLKVYSNAAYVEEAGDVIGYELAFEQRSSRSIKAHLYIYQGVPNLDSISLSGKFSGGKVTMEGNWIQHLIEEPSKKEITEVRFL